MVIDLNILRIDRGGNPDIVMKSERNRFKGTEHVEKILELDKFWKTMRHQLDTLNRQKNSASKFIGKKMKKKEEIGKDVELPELNLISITNDEFELLSISQLKLLSKNIDNEIANTSKILNTTEKERDDILNEIGNILHCSVFISNNEEFNEVLRISGDCAVQKTFSHVDLLLMINGADYKRGSAIAGNRGYFLKGPGVFIAQALIQHSLRFLNRMGFTVLYTPFFMKKNVMYEVAQLSQFDDELYKVVTKTDDKSKDYQEDEKYLIATSEQTIAAYHKGEWLSQELLPLKYAGLSTCFRQEVGSHGRDTAGIFRVHQFEKVE
uniref:serine--tRNA ligase n=1 Tax=Henneguya salminicola TaxID=69463 RepID=A0A6G3MG96_HENSL